MKELLPVFTAFLGGAFSFLIMFKTNKWNDERVRVQNENEKQKEMRNLMLVKGEDLYTLLSEWSKLIFNYQMCLIRVAKNDITKSQMDEIMNGAGTKGAHDRLITLLNLYFPSLREDFEIANKHRGDSVSAGIEFDKKKIESSVCMTRVNAASIKFEKQIEVVQEKLRKELSKYIN